MKLIKTPIISSPFFLLSPSFAHSSIHPLLTVLLALPTPSSPCTICHPHITTLHLIPSTPYLTLLAPSTFFSILPLHPSPYSIPTL